MVGAPPVVRLITQFERCLMTFRNGAKASGLWSGWPVLGLRACRCTMAAPASAASTAASAISCGVTGNAFDIEGVWIAPVTAQVMMTLRLMLCSLSGGLDTSLFVVLGGLVRGQRRRALVAPLRQCRDALGRRPMRPRRDYPVYIRALVHVRPGGSRRKLLVETGVARAIIRDAAGRIEFDSLEGSEKRPAQAKPVLHRVIEVFGRNKTFADQAECFGEQRALQPVQDKAVDLAVDRNRHLPDLAIDFVRAVDRVRRGPRRAAKLD